MSYKQIARYLYTKVSRYRMQPFMGGLQSLRDIKSRHLDVFAELFKPKLLPRFRLASIYSLKLAKQILIKRIHLLRFTSCQDSNIGSTLIGKPRFVNLGLYLNFFKKNLFDLGGSLGFNVSSTKLSCET